MKFFGAFVCALILIGCSGSSRTIQGYWTLADPRSSNRFPLWHFDRDGVLEVVHPSPKAAARTYRYRISGSTLRVTALDGGHELMESGIDWETKDRIVINDPGSFIPGRNIAVLSRIQPAGAEIAHTMVETDPGEGLSLECAQQMTKIARGLIMYSEDNDGRLPPSSTWMDASLRYAGGKPTAFRCPAIEAGYGYEFMVSLGGAAITAAMQAEDRAMVYDSANLAWNARGSHPMETSRHDGVRIVGTVNGGVRKEQVR